MQNSILYSSGSQPVLLDVPPRAQSYKLEYPLINTISYVPNVVL